MSVFRSAGVAMTIMADWEIRPATSAYIEPVADLRAVVLQAYLHTRMSAQL
ncbi:hypothetical protein ACIRRA_36780 [Nocardia sp. NPDC101769]|uniref:hypothetical protein n=1 Tax=Nocardia sp. NPDC101769 TaxID=3364333 RepID=UPI00382DA946